MIKNFQDLMAAAKKQKKMRLAIAAAQDADVLGAICKAAEIGLVDPVLIGDVDKIKAIAAAEGVRVDDYELVDVKELEETARVAVSMVSRGKADFLMKGLIDTAILLKAVLDKEIGLRTDTQLSHVMVYDLPTYHKLIFLTDGGMNIEPNLDQKVMIVKNAAKVAKAMGLETVKVAAICAKEKVNPKMQSTVDAKELENMSKNGDFGPGVIVEGPLAFDLAVSKEAAEVKGFKSEISGDTDVLLVPTIEVGNGIGKCMSYMVSGSDSAGIVMGAKVPVVLVSRADSYQAKLNSIALGSVIAACK